MEFVVIWFCFAVGCALLAKKKNRSQAGWFLLGMLGGIFALGILLLLPNLNPVTEENYKRCPFCSEQILVDAKICKHCGSKVNISLEK